MNARFSQFALLLLTVAVLAYFACRPGVQPVGGPSSDRVHDGDHVLGEAGRIPVGVDLETLHAEIDQRLQQINARMSTYLHDSELSRFNRHQEDTWFEVSAETAAVVAAAQQVSRLTDGAFDVTVGPLVNLWNFGPDPGSARVPDRGRDRTRAVAGRLPVSGGPPVAPGAPQDAPRDLRRSGRHRQRLRHRRGGRIARRPRDRRFMVEVGGEVRTRGKKQTVSPGGWASKSRSA
jgi:FAD:protein FMN transferase